MNGYSFHLKQPPEETNELFNKNDFCQLIVLSIKEKNYISAQCVDLASDESDS